MHIYSMDNVNWNNRGTFLKGTISLENFFSGNYFEGTLSGELFRGQSFKGTFLRELFRGNFFRGTFSQGTITGYSMPNPFFRITLKSKQASLDSSVTFGSWQWDNGPFLRLCLCNISAKFWDSTFNNEREIMVVWKSQYCIAKSTLVQ
jgi:hypothetical protein